MRCCSCRAVKRKQTVAAGIGFAWNSKAESDLWRLAFEWCVVSCGKRGTVMRRRDCAAPVSRRAVH